MSSSWCFALLFILWDMLRRRFLWVCLSAVANQRCSGWSTSRKVGRTSKPLRSNTNPTKRSNVSLWKRIVLYIQKWRNVGGFRFDFRGKAFVDQTKLRFVKDQLQDAREILGRTNVWVRSALRNYFNANYFQKLRWFLIFGIPLQAFGVSKSCTFIPPVPFPWSSSRQVWWVSFLKK